MARVARRRLQHLHRRKRHQAAPHRTAGRAAAVVSDNELPFRGIEVSGSPTIVVDSQFAAESFGRIATRYLGEKRAQVYMEGAGGGMVVIRLVPGRLRTWDFADDYALAGSLPEQ